MSGACSSTLPYAVAAFTEKILTVLLFVICYSFNNFLAGFDYVVSNVGMDGK
jgi:hypothetical protein